VIDISNALKIEGWMTPEELRWLATQASRCQSIVEVGSYAGRSTRALADNCPGKVTAVDTWAPGPWTKDIDWMTDDLASQYERFRANMSPHIAEGKVVPVRESSVNAANSATVAYDMIFIDGAHDYASVKKDILVWGALTRGLLCGHDYDHPGVKQAVTELVPNHENPVGTIWVRV
jgi:predicted O-methyltransferase YrrM